VTLGRGTDPEGVAAERFGTGEEDSPPADGASPRPGYTASGKKIGRPRKGDRPRKSAPAPPPERTKEEAAEAAKLCSFLVATLTDIALPMAKHRTLTDDEAKLVGGALEPVLNKYLPDMAGWALEINLLVVCAMLWQATAPAKPETNSQPPGENRLSIE